MTSLDELNQRGVGLLPGYLGIVFTYVADGQIRAELPLRRELMAANGYLHAGTVVTLADTAAGFGCLSHLPPGATGFTTIELKSNFLGTALSGTIEAAATLVHRGRTTQVWDATVTHKDTGKVIALFRCSQMILYPSAPSSPTPR